MERGSDKHSRLLDEALKHDTDSLRRGGQEARSEEFREQEGPAEGEPTPDARIRGGGDIPGSGLSLDDLNGRTELARYLEHRKFPARPDELAAHARERHAPDSVVAQLLRAPDQLYETVSEVWAALGGRVEHHRARD
ncbi:MAG TPA: DUF2795 domain-containing protein [Acidimicrobiia bacterium]|nr:DUF2795 domain-containing protein [Acidimicrobiia bacterium]